MNEMREETKEAVAFFKSEAVYKKVFRGFKRKYESLGRVGGSISLASFSEKEVEELAIFLGVRSDKLLERGTLTLRQFEKQLKEYRFGDLSLKDLLEAYFGEPLVSNKERAELRLEKKRVFFEMLKNKYSGLDDWLNYLELKNPDSHWIHRLMRESFVDFEEYVNLLNEAIKNLPEKPVRLPVFAQQLTKNPHGFDRDQNLGKLLLHVFSVKHAFAQGKEVVVPLNSEEITDLLFQYHILRDDLTNYLTVANLLAITSDNKEEVWRAACASNSVLNVPIRELIEVEALYPAGKNQQVWIVENSGVFSSLLDEVPNTPLICTHGQFTLAAWKTFDLLVAQDIQLNYSGDFDPEGLGMAVRLLQRYPNHVKLWKMDSTSYQKSLSMIEEISEIRLKQLSRIDLLELEEVKNEILKTKTPGYQEALLDELVIELAEKVK